MVNSQHRPPDMVLRELSAKLNGSRFNLTGSGFPIVHYRDCRILWKQRHGRFEVYQGHRDAGNTTPLTFTSETALLLHFDGLAAQVSCAPTCPYCGTKSVLQDRAYVYGPGFTDGKVYVCGGYPKCDAYVGAAANTHEPLGTLANAELRELRGISHLVFDPMWKGQTKITRVDAYKVASSVLGIPNFHIGTADIDSCKKLIEQIDNIRSALRAKELPALCLSRPRAPTVPQTMSLF